MTVKDFLAGFNRTQAYKDAGFNYLGSTTQSAKLKHSYENGWETYGIYLAPATLARDRRHPAINVCPNSSKCAAHCLHGAGQNKVETMAHPERPSHHTMSRIRKTHLFYDDREFFMKLMLSEIERYRNHAAKNGMGFSIRLNCTSDLSPELFKVGDRNVLEMYPDVQFYDYTKVKVRLKLAEKYNNYCLVYSYDGTNWQDCEEYLRNGGRVAVVFDTRKNGKQVLPKEWRGFKVIDANKYDMRFLDPAGTIMGLKYHRVIGDYVDGIYTQKETDFIVRSFEEKAVELEMAV